MTQGLLCLPQQDRPKGGQKGRPVCFDITVSYDSQKARIAVQYWVKSIVLSMVLSSVTGLVRAADEAAGYVENSQGSILRSGTGDCVHSGYWQSEMATIVACDGVTLDAPVVVIEGRLPA